MVVCPICKQEAFEQGMLFSGQWVCSDCIQEIAIAHRKMVQGGNQTWKELGKTKV